jgi:diguanylate cyclase (GGDEF)-like protein
MPPSQGDLPTAAPSEAALPAVALLGDNARLRLRLGQHLLATAFLLACVGIAVYAGSLSGTPLSWIALWACACLLMFGLWYALIRSGWSERFEDPSLTRPQIISALMMGVAAYPLTGELRGVVLPILTLVLVFGMFRLKQAEAMLLAWLGLALLGAAMAVGIWVWPGNFEPSRELGHFMMAMVTLPGVSVLAGRLSRIRIRLTEQRQALNAALARIEELATRDQLTGLPNRRQGEVQLQKLLLRFQRTGAPACVAMLDLDYFKRVNDTHGHAVGDAVLRAFAQAGLSSLRATDSLARWGGEEFLLLLEDSDPRVAGIAMQRLQFAVADAAVEVDGRALGFTFSAGLTALREGDTPLSVVARADRALYGAKAAGRNQTVVD